MSCPLSEAWISKCTSGEGVDTNSGFDRLNDHAGVPAVRTGFLRPLVARLGPEKFCRTPDGAPPTEARAFRKALVAILNAGVAFEVRGDSDFCGLSHGAASQCRVDNKPGSIEPLVRFA